MYPQCRSPVKLQRGARKDNELVLGVLYFEYGVGPALESALRGMGAAVVGFLCVNAHRWERLRGRPWAVAVERSLALLAIGLMAAGVYTVARSAVTDWPTAILAVGAGIILAKRWLPTAAGAMGWLLGSSGPRAHSGRTRWAIHRSILRLLHPENCDSLSGCPSEVTRSGGAGRTRARPS
jgi:hypothetical protein